MSISINSGAAYTNSTSVTLKLTSPAGADRMRFSDDGTTFGGWETFSTPLVDHEKPHVLPAGDGEKKVYVAWAKLEQGNPVVLQTESASITLDTEAPTGTLGINGGDSTTASTSVTLTLNASDTTAIEYRAKNESDASFPSTWTPLGQNGTDVPLAWTLSDGPGWKTVQVELRDLAGNTSTLSDQIELIVNQPGHGLWLNFKTPSYLKSDDSYFRMGAAKTSDENALAGKAELSSNEDVRKKILEGGNTRAGWFEYTDGDRTQITRGQDADIVNGERLISTEGNATTYVKGTATSILGNKKEAALCTQAFNWGDNISLYGGMKLFATVGSVVTTTLGATVAANATVDFAFNMSHKLDISLGTKFSWGTDELKHVTHSGTKAKKSINLRIKSTPEPHLASKKTIGLLVGAGLGSAAAVTSTVGLISLGETKADDLTGAAVTLGIGGAASIGALVASLIILKTDKMKSLLDKMKHKFIHLQNGAPAVAMRSGKKADTELSMTKDGILLTQNNARGASQAMLSLGDPKGEVLLANEKGCALGLRADGDTFLTSDATTFVSAKDEVFITAGPRMVGSIGVDQTGNVAFAGIQADFFDGVLTVMK